KNEIQNEYRIVSRDLSNLGYGQEVTYPFLHQRYYSGLTLPRRVPTATFPHFHISTFPHFHIFTFPHYSNRHQTASSYITVIYSPEYLKAAVGKKPACIFGSNKGAGINIGKVNDIDHAASAIYTA